MAFLLKQKIIKNMLSLENISFSYGTNPIIDKANYDFTPDSFTVLHGPNGVGKTTFLRIAAGLIPPNQGKVTRSSDLKVLFIPYESGLYLDASALWNLKFLTACFKTFVPTETLLACLKEYLVPLKGPVRILSSGQRKRIMLCLWKLIKPDIVIADEPFNGLDSPGQELLASLIKTSTGLATCHDKSHFSYFNKTVSFEEL
jgi:ABC-type multidrug transport system ATPase subunit